MEFTHLFKKKVMLYNKAVLNSTLTKKYTTQSDTERSKLKNGQRYRQRQTEQEA